MPCESCNDLGAMTLHPAQQPGHPRIAEGLELTDGALIHLKQVQERCLLEPLHRRCLPRCRRRSNGSQVTLFPSWRERGTHGLRSARLRATGRCSAARRQAQGVGRVLGKPSRRSIVELKGDLDLADIAVAEGAGAPEPVRIRLAWRKSGAIDGNGDRRGAARTHDRTRSESGRVGGILLLNLHAHAAGKPARACVGNRDEDRGRRDVLSV